jgi:hypothetical protein
VIVGVVGVHCGNGAEEAFIYPQCINIHMNKEKRVEEANHE